LYLNDVQFDGRGLTKKKAKINAIMKFNTNSYIDKKNNHIIINKKQEQKIICTNNNVMNHAIQKKIQQYTSYPIPPKTKFVLMIDEIFAGQTLVCEHNKSYGVVELDNINIFGNKYTSNEKNKTEVKLIDIRYILEKYIKRRIMENCTDPVEMFRIDYKESKILDYFAHITDSVYQKIKFSNQKIDIEYSVITSIIKVNKLLVFFF